MSNGRYKPYPKYKPTGATWVESVPHSWDVFVGKRIFESCREIALSSDEQLAASQKFGVVPQSLMMELNDAKVMLALKGTSTFRHVEKHDFVISLRSFEGGIEYSAYTGCVSPAYTVLRPTKPIVSAYYKHLFKSRPYISALQATTDSLRDGKAINYEQFGAIPLVLPPLPEQIQIAKFLDHETAKIDRLIEKQEELIRLLKEKRQAVISHAVTKGLNPHAPLKDSGIEWLGQVPAHWAVKKLKHLLSRPLMYGANEAALETDKSQPRFIRITDVADDGTLREETFRSLKESIARPYILSTGDVLLARSGGTVGKSVIYSEDWGRCCFAGYLIKASFCEKDVAEWFYRYTDTLYYWQWINSTQIQATIQNVSAEKYAEFYLTLPPSDEMRAISLHLHSVSKKAEQMIEKAEAAASLLQERRTALISAAVTGKIDVRHWQPPADEAA